jgi:hypothetical protein
MAEIPHFLIGCPLGGAEWRSERRKVMFAKTHNDTSMRVILSKIARNAA